jgi:hypothetical protein
MPFLRRPVRVRGAIDIGYLGLTGFIVVSSQMSASVMVIR